MARFGTGAPTCTRIRTWISRSTWERTWPRLVNSPVPAANNGIVVLAENVGIYGNTVMIDHGLGVFIRL